MPIPRDKLAETGVQGDETAIGAALAAALAAHRGQPLSGILVASDGQSNAGEDPRKVAEQAGKQGVPIVSLAAGTLEGPSNARLSAIEADPVVFVRDPTEIGVLVEGHGMQGRTGAVVLEKRQDAAWTEVGAKRSPSTRTTPANAWRFSSPPMRSARSISALASKTWAPS